MRKESDTGIGDNPAPLIFIVIGEVQKDQSGERIPFNALMAAPDDDTAVRIILKTLADKGYLEADLHQIGNLDDAPEGEAFHGAYQAALKGEVALIFYESG